MVRSHHRGGIVKRGKACAVHYHKSRNPQEDHHILPKEFGGPTTKANLALCCSNGHGDTHYFLNLLLKFDGEVPWEIAQHFSKRVRDLAQRGYDAIVGQGEDLMLAAQTVAIARLDRDERMEKFGLDKVAAVLSGRS